MDNEKKGGIKNKCQVSDLRKQVLEMLFWRQETTEQIGQVRDWRELTISI